MHKKIFNKFLLSVILILIILASVIKIHSVLSFPKISDWNHYIKVNVSDSGVKYDVVKLPSPDFEWINSLVHDAWIYIYAFFAIHFWDSIIILALIYLGFCLIFLKKEWLIGNISKQRKQERD